MEAPTLERRPSAATKAEIIDKRKKELREAAERVYRKYGTDLNAFRRDTQRELEKRAI